ncbi:unnamed protein product [Ceratitis capitata]|uniref:(Mediterranean fruit fly) hypothetical protein n=1 Tax=Ceratitis capitata TaxID=7213 RepID=A0A811UQZ9_CERCA|nr:unnamed protein product [Ceratitis capitata]
MRGKTNIPQQVVLSSLSCLKNAALEARGYSQTSKHFQEAKNEPSLHRLEQREGEMSSIDETVESKTNRKGGQRELHCKNNERGRSRLSARSSRCDTTDSRRSSTERSTISVEGLRSPLRLTSRTIRRQLGDDCDNNTVRRIAASAVITHRIASDDLGVVLAQEPWTYKGFEGD